MMIWPLWAIELKATPNGAIEQSKEKGQGRKFQFGIKSLLNEVSLGPGLVLALDLKFGGLDE